MSSGKSHLFTRPHATPTYVPLATAARALGMAAKTLRNDSRWRQRLDARQLPSKRWVVPADAVAALVDPPPA